MAVAVERHGVALTRDPFSHPRQAFYLLADEEEGGSRAGLAEQVEERGSALGVRAVVEGERHAAGAGRQPSRHAKRIRHRGHKRRESGC